MADPEKAMEVENDHEDLEDEEVDGTVGKSTMAAELLKNPAMFAALQGKLNSMVGVNSGYISVRISTFAFTLIDMSFESKKNAHL